METLEKTLIDHVCGRLSSLTNELENDCSILRDIHDHEIDYRKLKHAQECLKSIEDERKRQLDHIERVRSVDKILSKAKGAREKPRKEHRVQRVREKEDATRESLFDAEAGLEGLLVEEERSRKEIDELKTRVSFSPLSLFRSTRASYDEREMERWLLLGELCSFARMRPRRCASRPIHERLLQDHHGATCEEGTIDLLASTRSSDLRSYFDSLRALLSKLVSDAECAMRDESGDVGRRGIAIDRGEDFRKKLFHDAYERWCILQQLLRRVRNLEHGLDSPEGHSSQPFASFSTCLNDILRRKKKRMKELKKRKTMKRRTYQSDVDEGDASIIDVECGTMKRLDGALGQEQILKQLMTHWLESYEPSIWSDVETLQMSIEQCNVQMSIKSALFKIGKQLLESLLEVGRQKEWMNVFKSVHSVLINDGRKLGIFVENA